ncbi:MAG: response regulator transcription factor [Bacteroidetes bacterium]|nr:response regulator transcription factor [Bacteroidota bacterium]
MEKIRIMLADDHAVFREGMRKVLAENADMEIVGEAANGKEAVSLAAELAPDVAIMDIVMPELNGIEATKQIKEISPSTAVLILTAYDDERYILGLLEAGAAGYLLKNARSQQLANAIRAVRAGESVLLPEVARKLLRRASRPSALTDHAGAEELTARELEVLKLAAKGMSNKDIARKLFLSVRTVKAHLYSIFGKMQVGSRTEAVLKGLKRGLVSIEDTPDV